MIFQWITEIDIEVIVFRRTEAETRSPAPYSRISSITAKEMRSEGADNGWPPVNSGGLGLGRYGRLMRKAQGIRFRGLSSRNYTLCKATDNGSRRQGVERENKEDERKNKGGERSNGRERGRMGGKNWEEYCWDHIWWALQKPSYVSVDLGDPVSEVERVGDR